MRYRIIIEYAGAVDTWLVTNDKAEAEAELDFLRDMPAGTAHLVAFNLS